MVKKKVSPVKTGILMTGVLGGVLAVLVTLGVLSVTIAAIIMAVMILGMLIMYGGGSELATGLSDAEGFENQIEEEEQRKAEEAEYFGEAKEGGHGDE